MAEMDVELADLVKTVDLAVLGARIHDARVDQGLTQAQVAGDEMSTGYVSRIESGTRRPDPQLLDVIASRVGTTAEELLTGTTRDRATALQVLLDWAELSLRTGDARGALDQADQILSDVAGLTNEQPRRAALRVKAGALQALGRLDDAIMVLEDMTEDTTVDLAWIAAMNALSRCHSNAGDFSRAIEIGELALVEVRRRSLEGTDQAVSLSLVVAGAYAERGDNAHARRLVRRTLSGATALGSVESRAKAYWSASILESRAGDAVAALTLARKALALMETSEDARNVALLRSQLGILFLRGSAPEPDAALQHLREAEDALRLTDATALDLAVNRLYQSRALFLLGDLDEAASGAHHSRSVASADSPLVAAEASVILGQIALSRGEHELARSHYQDAVIQLTSAGSDQGVAQLWFELACRLEDLADTDGALDAYRRAGVSTGLLPAHATAGDRGTVGTVGTVALRR